MARRREQTVERDEGELILPRHLADQTGLNAQEYRKFWVERRAWLKAHGVNERDWSQVHPILRASWAAYGIERPERRLRVTDPSWVLTAELENRR